MIDHLKRAIAGGRAGFRECRDCGTTVEGPAVGCPECGSREIARYDL